MKLYKTFECPARKADICVWWSMYEHKLPQLARIARMILAIPASSAKSERVFSVGSRTVTALRGNLAPKKVEELIVIKENMVKIREFKENTSYKLPRVEEDPFSLVVTSTRPSVMAEEEDDIEMVDYEDMDEEEEEVLELDLI